MTDPTTQEEDKKLDEISATLGDAIRNAMAFYDCRLVLAVLLGQAGVLAASLRQAGILPPIQIIHYFTTGLVSSFVDNQKVPKVSVIGTPTARN